MGGQVRLIRVIPATRTSLPALPVASPTPIATAATTPYVSEASPPAVFPLCPAFTASIQRGTSPLFSAHRADSRSTSRHFPPKIRKKVNISPQKNKLSPTEN